MKTRTHVKASGVDFANHNQTQLASTPLRRRDLRVKTGVKAGPVSLPDEAGSGDTK